MEELYPLLLDLGDRVMAFSSIHSGQDCPPDPETSILSLNSITPLLFEIDLRFPRSHIGLLSQNLSTSFSSFLYAASGTAVSTLEKFRTIFFLYPNHKQSPPFRPHLRSFSKFRDLFWDFSVYKIVISHFLNFLIRSVRVTRPDLFPESDVESALSLMCGEVAHWLSLDGSPETLIAGYFFDEFLSLYHPRRIAERSSPKAFAKALEVLLATDSAVNDIGRKPREIRRYVSGFLERFARLKSAKNGRIPLLRICSEKHREASGLVNSISSFRRTVKS